ncbi:high-affinity iron transporter [Candidatus Peregrinibacteria bacterium CG10_big_fil_rev_8_21_14_0_10_36_19]|nr:MAG: high-affinity iron transporter [Candidatus Peregrinibacteria bacterium CG10_big_fil_rev_8_21_14_0_10_36_19]
MFAALIITLRETLEVALVVGIVLAYLKKTINGKHQSFVWGGLFAGVVVSALIAYVFEKYFGGFEGTAEQIYEGVAMFTAAALLSWMILWMLEQRRKIKEELEKKVSVHIEKDHPIGLLSLVFVSTLREGVETSIFLKAAILSGGSDGTVLGAVSGILIALAVSYVLFKGFARVPLKTFFTITSVILILFAAGLFAHGIHEFQEAGVFPIYIEHLWDINNFLDENGSFGGVMKGVFGYNGNPSLLEVVGYFGYLVLIAFYSFLRKK